MRTLALWILIAAVSGCSGDDDDTGDGGNGGASGTAGTSGTGGTGGNAAGGTGGNAAGGTGGNGAGGTGGGSNDSGVVSDSGHDAGPQTTRCVAPTPNNTPGNTCPAPGTTPALQAVEVVGGLTRPIFVLAAPGDATRLFVVEREGAIRIVDRINGNQLLAAPFINVPMVGGSGVGSNGGEQGLLGMAFHPDYPTDPRFFVNYTDSSGDTVVRSFEVSASDPNLADMSKGGTLITIPQPEGNHNGGMIAFGPDGCLFVGSGDGGGSDDLHGAPTFPGNGQNLDTTSGNLDVRLGKMLRFDVDAPTAGAPGNLTTASIPHIWDYGLRNPWRFSFDRQTGDLYIADVGQGAREEVDVEAAGTGKLNYGWKITEGAICRPGGPGSCDMNGLTAPVYDYPHSGGDDCIVGGYVYRGSAIPSLQGFYLLADNGPSKSVRAFVWNGTGRCNNETVTLTNQFSNIQGDITSFGEDSAGEMYITSFGTTGSGGKLYRIDAD